MLYWAVNNSTRKRTEYIHEATPIVTTNTSQSHPSIYLAILNALRQPYCLRLLPVLLNRASRVHRGYL
ncbi:hypothetical protein ACN38_g5030 [Penicillium nordicum]|uniref:Uncharacterized protein n=1 Tax=Penicillium nordicum TaxID=229535 RepID=A0A0M8PB25_9EURO|nr:hypothetical protein ACN38_g5030 [Penicillium nordicum]